MSKLEPTNADRWARADKALKFYKQECLKEGGSHDPDTVTDLLTDLRHYCQGMDLTSGEKGTFKNSVARSLYHFEAEKFKALPRFKWERL